MQPMSFASKSGRRLDRMVKYKIRLVDITEYPVKGYPGTAQFHRRHQCQGL